MHLMQARHAIFAKVLLLNFTYSGNCLSNYARNREMSLSAARVMQQQSAT